MKCSTTQKRDSIKLIIKTGRSGLFYMELSIKWVWNEATVILTIRDTFIWKLNVTPLLLHINYSSNCGSCTATSPWNFFHWSVNHKNLCTYLTFMLPRIVIDFFFKLSTDALIIQILFCYKTLHVSGIISAHHQEFSTVHSALVSFMQGYDDASKQSQEVNAVPSWLCLKAVIKTCMKLTSAESTVENSWCWAENMPETFRVL